MHALPVALTLTLLNATQTTSPPRPAGTAVSEQTATASEALLNLDPGRTVWITTRQAQVVTGTLVSASERVAEVRTRRGMVTVTPASIIRIDVNHGRNTKRGALMGAVIGGITFPMLVAMDDCEPGTLVCFSGPRWVALGAAWGVGLGAGIGALAGLSSPRRVQVYPSFRRSLSIAPVLGHGRAELRAAVAW